jgi:hypothetical protein
VRMNDGALKGKDNDRIAELLDEVTRQAEVDALFK